MRAAQLRGPHICRGDFHFERGRQGFIEAYTRRSRREVTEYKLSTTAEQDEAMVAFIRNPRTNPERGGFSLLKNNCATAVCSVLRGGRVIAPGSNPSACALGLADTPGALETSLEQGELSDSVPSETHYRPPLQGLPSASPVSHIGPLDAYFMRNVTVDGITLYMPF